MEIQSQYNDGQLSIAILGRVDAAEAQKLQLELLALVDTHNPVTTIIIDASQLSFISSMGLRVLLILKKKIDDLHIFGVNPEVYNVFAITGLHKILDIQKALPQVSIEGCPLVSGREEVYQLTADTVLKLFPIGTTRAQVDQEVAMTKEVLVMGIPTAMAFDIVMVGQQFGLIYESTTPTQVSADTLGRMLRQLHSLKVNPEEETFASAPIEIKRRIDTLEPHLGSEAVSQLQQMLKVLPFDTSLLHGNLSLDCIMMQNGETIFTDMGTVRYGHPVLDFAHLYASFSEEQRGEYFDELLDEYFDMESDETIKRHKENIVILSAIYEFISLTANGSPTAEQVEECRKRFKEIIADRWTEIQSRLRFKMDFAEEMRTLEREQFYLDSDVNIDWIAQKLGTNRHYVSDYFNKVLHCTFNDYINNLRLTYAAKLVREGRVPKSQVCYEAGFTNDHTFRRLFKQKFGCLPSQYEG